MFPFDCSVRYFESKDSPASESLCYFLILFRQNYLTQKEGHQGRLWLLLCLVYRTPVEASIATLYLIVCDGAHIKGRQMAVFAPSCLIIRYLTFVWHV